VSAVTADRTAVSQLLEALETSEDASNLSCGFFACPGPDKPFVHMATCHVCRTTQLLRRALARMGVQIETKETR